jgi:hypothetical protein
MCCNHPLHTYIHIFIIHTLIYSHTDVCLCVDEIQLHNQIQRIKSFVQIFTSTLSNNTNLTNATADDNNNNNTALLILLREIQKALTKEENFPSDSLFTSLEPKFLTKLVANPLKFKICRGLFLSLSLSLSFIHTFTHSHIHIHIFIHSHSH